MSLRKRTTLCEDIVLVENAVEVALGHEPGVLDAVEVVEDELGFVAVACVLD